MDLRRFWQIVRRRWIVVLAGAILFFVIGAAFITLRPPLTTSKAIVVLPPSTHDTGTQVVIAGSNSVLQGSLGHIYPPVSLPTLRQRVQVESLTPDVVQFIAHAKTAAQAEDMANAVANSYIAYIGNRQAPGGTVVAKMLQKSVSATVMSPAKRLALYGGLGGLLGLVIGAVAAVLLSRGDRRLRFRDEIADAIGVPVLASIPVSRRPSDAVGWNELIANYSPGVVHAWSLRKALQMLGLTDRETASPSLTVLSLASDKGALALGPQLAAFTAGLGIQTVLVVGPQQDADATATLRAACAITSSIAEPALQRLQITDGEHENASQQTKAALTIVVAVVDGQAPRLINTVPTTTAILGVSAGATSAEQLARVAVCAAGDGREIAGIIVANPDSTDNTTGRLPQLSRPEYRKPPSRLSGRSETRL
jgi:capsular polysaccharide biosynthesis protein